MSREELVRDEHIIINRIDHEVSRNEGRKKKEQRKLTRIDKRTLQGRVKKQYYKQTIGETKVQSMEIAKAIARKQGCENQRANTTSKATDFERQNLMQRVKQFIELNFRWFLLFLLVHQKFHHFLRVSAGKQEELSTPVDDAQQAKVVRNTQNTPLATDKGDTHVVGAGLDSTDNIHVEFRVLDAMDHCGGTLLWCTPGIHTVQLVAAGIDETIAVGGLDGTYVLVEARATDNWKLGYTRVPRKEGHADSCLGEDVCPSHSQVPESLEATPSLS